MPMPSPSAASRAATLSTPPVRAGTDMRVPASGDQPMLPLQGVTILVVEDSRFACEALRLMAMRSGARLRRADTLREARAHLKLYRPDVVIIDLGLPDGSGTELIAELAIASRGPAAVLGSSGDPAGRAAALAAGADGFLDKPLESLARFAATLQRALHQNASALLREATIIPDPLALHDDLARAAHSLDTDPAARVYVTAFLLGVARHARDADLLQAAKAAAVAHADLRPLRNLLRRRLDAPEAGFFSQN